LLKLKIINENNSKLKINECLKAKQIQMNASKIKLKCKPF